MQAGAVAFRCGEGASSKKELLLLTLKQVGENQAKASKMPPPPPFPNKPLKKL